MSINRIHDKMVRILENRRPEEKLDSKSRAYRVMYDVLSDYFVKDIKNLQDYCPICGSLIEKYMIYKKDCTTTYPYCYKCCTPLTRTIGKGMFVKETIEDLDRIHIGGESII